MPRAQHIPIPVEVEETQSSDKTASDVKGKQTPASRWVGTRQGKKKRSEESDSDSSITQEPRRHKAACCSPNSLHITLKAVQKEVKAMNLLLNSIKEEQDSRLLLLQKDVSVIKSDIGELKKSNTEFEKTLQFLSTQYDEMETFKKETMEHNKAMENRYKDLIQRNINLDKCNKALEERIGYIEQKELNKNIEIMNLKMQEGEKTVDVVKKCAEILELDKTAIESARRVGSEKKEVRPIVVTLNTKAARVEWLKSRKTQITNHMILNNNDSSRIFINEHITRHNRQLFWATKTKLKDTYKYIWIQDAKILIKKNDIDKKIYHIRNEGDMETYVQKEKI